MHWICVHVLFAVLAANPDLKVKSRRLDFNDYGEEELIGRNAQTAKRGNNATGQGHSENDITLGRIVKQGVKFLRRSIRGLLSDLPDKRKGGVVEIIEDLVN